MPNWSDLSFEGKHVDEKILHFSGPSPIRTRYEVFRILFPSILVTILVVALGVYQVISIGATIGLVLVLMIFMAFSTWYKLHRVKRNYVIITSKRVIFAGLDGLFKDYVKKITFDNIRNVNYFTDSFLGKLYGFGTLEIQSSHNGQSDIHVYHIPYGKLITHYIDKIISLDPEKRKDFPEFDPEYFKNWKK